MSAGHGVCGVVLAGLVVAVELGVTGCGAPRNDGPATGSVQAGSASPVERASSSPAPTCRPSVSAGGQAAGRRSGDVQLADADNGATVCAALGNRVTVYLTGTPGERWTIGETGSALRPAANGRGMLPVGVQGGFFVAAQRGTARVTGVRGPCRTPSPGTPGCDAQHAFVVTVVVR